MNDSLTRRAFLLAVASAPFALARASAAANRHDASAQAGLEELERQLDGRLGVFALDTATGAHLGYRAAARFPMCSTSKVLIVCAILRRSTHSAGLMQRRIRYGRADLQTYSPVTGKHVADGMTVADLCAAAMEYSDNTAANLLMKVLGGPAAVTAFARTVGDDEFRLDRWEPDLNTAVPGDPRDTSTPEAMGRSLERLALGDALAAPQRALLCDWLRGCTTGAARIRAGVPVGWRVGDKTGSGDYGTANDVAVLWPPRHAPVIVAVFTTRRQQRANYREDILASAARIAVAWIGRGE